MQIPKDAALLRIFIGEKDRHGHSPLYEALVLKAREAGLAGATVIRGPLGFGPSSILTRRKSCISPRICRSSSKSSMRKHASRPSCRRSIA